MWVEGVRTTKLGGITFAVRVHRSFVFLFLFFVSFFVCVSVPRIGLNERQETSQLIRCLCFKYCAIRSILFIRCLHLNSGTVLEYANFIDLLAWKCEKMSMHFQERGVGKRGIPFIWILQCFGAQIFTVARARSVVSSTSMSFGERELNQVRLLRSLGRLPYSEHCLTALKENIPFEYT